MANTCIYCKDRVALVYLEERVVERASCNTCIGFYDDYYAGEAKRFVYTVCFVLKSGEIVNGEFSSKSILPLDISSFKYIALLCGKNFLEEYLNCCDKSMVKSIGIQLKDDLEDDRIKT